MATSCSLSALLFPSSSSWSHRISNNPPPRLNSHFSSIKVFQRSPIFSSHLHSSLVSNVDFQLLHRNLGRSSYSLERKSPNLRVYASSSEDSQFPTAEGMKGQVLTGSAIAIVLAVANRVLYKLALVPMKEYPFFLAQVTTFGYVGIYFSILIVRYLAGIVTDEMLALPKSRFMLIGILEALGVAAGMSAGAMLPGPAIPILNQTFLVWQLMFSTMILGRRYSFNQIVGCLLVAVGVVVAVASVFQAFTVLKNLSMPLEILAQYVISTCGSNEGQMLSNIEFIWPAIMIASSAFQAGASILKEFVFIDAAERLKGKPLDIFVVNSFGSGFQALFILFFLPFLSNMKGIPFGELPSYLRSGAACFLNIGTNVTGCDGAPLLPLLFISMNMAFNISLLSLVKISSAVISSLATTLAVPLTIYVLTLPLPYLPEGTSLSPFFLIGSVILVVGLVIYNLPESAKEDSKNV